MCLQVEALSANLIPARAAEEERRLPTPPADQPRSCWKVQCRELTQLRLRVELQVGARNMYPWSSTVVSCSRIRICIDRMRLQAGQERVHRLH